MRLDALDDEGHWGRNLCRTAIVRGWSAEVFTKASEVPSDSEYAFMRIAQKSPRHELEKAEAEHLLVRGVHLIPDIAQIRMYDDKRAQTLYWPLARLMPRSIVVIAPDDAKPAGRQLGYPLLSKSARGSASHDVRMINSEEQLEDEARKAFGDGIQARYSTQQGYLILQEFLPDNAYDYRVVAVGRRRMMLRRFNASASRPFASGSGKCVAIERIEQETADVLEAADEFFHSANTGWCGIDLVHDRSGAWKVLELTLGWTASAYARCRFFGTEYRGSDIWHVLLSEIEQGAFLPQGAI